MERRDPLAERCPQCHALPGQKCRNYRGVNCAPHRERGRRAPEPRDDQVGADVQPMQRELWEGEG